MNIKQDINMTRKPTDIEIKYDLRYIKKNKEEISAVSKSVSVLDTTKQTKLISGTNIKTINNESVLGSGNLNTNTSVGELSNLNTTNKTNVVSAINEINDISRMYLLFENSGGENGVITLSDSSANYKYLEIYYKTNDNAYSSVKVYEPNGKYVSLCGAFINTNTSKGYLKVKIVDISGTSITNHSSTSYGQIENNASGNVITNNNYIYITRVIGYQKIS